MRYFIKQNMKEGMWINELRAIQILNDILAGLLALHQNQIWHRDMKPENVIISDGVFKLCDYGMAKIIEEDDNPYSKRDFT